MVIKLQDKIQLDWETVKQRWKEAANNDPFDTISRLLQNKDYAGLAAILKKEKGTIRDRHAIPAALLLVPNLDYHALEIEMRKRNAYTKFISSCEEAGRIARKHRAPTTLDTIVPPDEVPPNPEYERIYEHCK